MKNKVVALALPCVKTYYKTVAIKIDCYLFRDKQIVQWTRIEYKETYLCIYRDKEIIGYQ